MIVISNPISVENEISLIHSLFAEGLELFHVRKPDYSEIDMKVFLSEIGLEFRERLVLHQHHQMAEDFGIERIHFTEKARKETSKEEFLHCEKKGFHLSTSVHKMKDFNSIENVFEYAFLSPVFESISKPGYASEIDFKTEIKERINNTCALVALGGITPNTITTAFEYGFNDVALLGIVWNTNNPIENFKLCQQIALSYSL